MHEREHVMQSVSARMTNAFATGDTEYAQNLNALLRALERMSDAEYEALASSDNVGAIS